MKKACLLLLLVALAGCMATSEGLKTALAPAQTIVNPISCEPANCKEYWDRAQVWIARHSMLKIQTATDVLIQTYNPTNSDVEFGFTAIKEPLGGGKYAISLGETCGNLLGCHINTQDLNKAFLYYVSTGRDLLDGQRLPPSIR